MVAVSPERIVVYALPEHRFQFEAALVACVALPPPMSEGLAVTFAQGTSIVDTLHSFVGDSKSTKRLPKTAASIR
jgi:hypothetical protein